MEVICSQKHRAHSKRQGATTQKTIIFIVTVVRISDPTNPMPNLIGSLLNCFLLSLLPCVLCYLAYLICRIIHSLQIQIYSVSGGHKYRDPVLQVGGWTQGCRPCSVRKFLLRDPKKWNPDGLIQDKSGYGSKRAVLPIRISILNLMSILLLRRNL
jgi:hypothetical protein